MKKFAKGCLIAALSMLTIGIIILAVCTFIGGTALFSYAHNEIKTNLNIDDFWGRNIITWHNGETHMDFNDEYPTHSGEYEDFQAALSSNITDINLKIGSGSCIISESSDDYFHIYSKNAEEFQYYTENHTFYVTGFEHASFGVHSDDYNYIYLEIPKDFYFENIDIELGAGIIEADALLATNDINMEIGAGELVADTLFADMLTADIGAGNLEVNKGSVKDSDLVIGLGNMTYSGIITGDLSTECGLGNLDLYLDDNVKNHNYELECSIGNITLNKTDYSGIAHTKSIEHDADSTYMLECDMGNINIDFKKE